MTAVVEPAASGLAPACVEPPGGFKMARPEETGRRPDPNRTQETVRQAKLHLSTASDMLDSAATAITRARELASEREHVSEELAEDIAALRSSARMLVDVLSE
jgi:hypothetical protein